MYTIGHTVVYVLHLEEVLGKVCPPQSTDQRHNGEPAPYRLWIQLQLQQPMDERETRSSTNVLARGDSVRTRYTSTTYNNLYSDVILIHGDVILNYGDVKACSTPGNSRLASKKANRGDVRTVRFPPLSIAFGFGFQKLKGADVARSHHRMLPNALSDKRHGVPRDIMNLGHEHVSFLHSSADVDVFEPRIEII
jgi:hypothetical protein